MKRYIKSATDKTYQNKRNENKFIETRKYDDGHTVSRQYMEWETPEGTVKNYNGAKDAKRGRWHRANKNTLSMQLEDYDEITEATVLATSDYMSTPAWQRYKDAQEDNGDPAWKVHIGFDSGDAESGPMVSDYWEVIYAPTAEDAENIVMEAYTGADAEDFCGCWAEGIDEEELQDYKEELAAYPPEDYFEDGNYIGPTI